MNTKTRSTTSPHAFSPSILFLHGLREENNVEEPINYVGNFFTVVVARYKLIKLNVVVVLYCFARSYRLYCYVDVCSLALSLTHSLAFLPFFFNLSPSILNGKVKMCLFSITHISTKFIFSHLYCCACVKRIHFILFLARESRKRRNAVNNSQKLYAEWHIVIHEYLTYKLAHKLST